MGTRDRTRPDESNKPGLITVEGYRKLELEADRLWNEERPRLAKAVAVAAAEGDRSENAEYIYGKKKMAEIDQRLKFLGNRLKVLTIVDQKPPADGKVYFGCYVKVENEEGEEFQYRIVGSDEFDADAGWISIESPMGKALLGKMVDDEVKVRRPAGDAFFTILKVSPDEPSE